MSYSLVASVKINSTDNASFTINGGTSTDIDTTGATLLVIAVRWYAGYTPPLVVSDSKGCMWHPLILRNLGGGTGANQQHFYAYQGDTGFSVGSGHNFTFGNNSTFGSADIWAFGGGDGGDVFDQENFNTDSGSVTSLTTGSVTPSKNNEVIITSIQDGNHLMDSIDSGFTLSHNWVGSGSSGGGAGAYKIKSDVAAENPTWAWTGANNAIAVISTFKLSTNPDTPGNPLFTVVGAQ